MIYGSHLFGTNVKGSDRDFKAVCLPPAKDILLQRTKQVSHNKGYEERNRPEQEDIEFLSLQRYLKLLCQGQTVAVDMAFVPEACYVGDIDPEWYAVRNNFKRFVHSSQIPIFTGFAQSQVRRYSTKAGRLTAAEAAHDFFKAMGDMYGPNTSLSQVNMDLMDLMCQYPKELMTFVRVPNPARDGASVEHFECCDRKVPMGASVKEAANIFRRAAAIYGKRTKLAQQMGGRDWKALYHAVRIVREAEELLLEGKITFPRPEAETLVEIREGKLPHARVIAMIEGGLERVAEAQKNTVLRVTPDYAFADELVASIYRVQVIRDRY
jgi:predicted nucleotidyltransferase